MDFILYGTMTLCLIALGIFMSCYLISNLFRREWFAAIITGTLLAIDIISIINIIPKIIL